MGSSQVLCIVQWQAMLLKSSQALHRNGPFWWSQALCCVTKGCSSSLTFMRSRSPLKQLQAGSHGGHHGLARPMWAFPLLVQAGAGVTGSRLPAVGAVAATVAPLQVECCCLKVRVKYPVRPGCFGEILLEICSTPGKCVHRKVWQQSPSDSVTLAPSSLVHVTEKKTAKANVIKGVWQCLPLNGRP